MIVKPGRLMIVNMQFGQMSRPSHCSHHRPGLCVEKCGGGSVIIWATICCYSAGPVITLNGRITASDYLVILGNQVLHLVQMFPNSDAIFQGDNSPIDTARNVQSWFEVRENALHHLP
jgi:hypothetical protein